MIDRSIFNFKPDFANGRASRWDDASLLAEIARGMREACLVLDANWKVVFYNDHGEPLLERRPEEVLQQSIWEVYPGLIGTALETICHRVMADRISATTDFLCPVAGRWQEVRVQPAGDGLIIWLLDIQERKSAEAAARNREIELNEAQRAARVGNWHWDAATGAIQFSREICRIFGRETIPPWAEQSGTMYSPEQWKRLASGFAAVLRTGIGYDFELPALHADGTTIWIHARCEGVRDEATGKIRAVRGTVQDVTERKQTEFALRDRAAELTALMDAIPAPVFVAHDTQCIHVTGNRAAAELFRTGPGASFSLSEPEAANPRHFRLAKDGQPLPIADRPVQRAARGFQVHGFEFSLEFEDGSSRDLVAYGTPLFDEWGKPRGAVVALTDVTELKSAQKGLRARMVELGSFVRQAPDKIAMLDGGLKHLAASKRWIDVFGGGRDELSGTKLDELFPVLPPQWTDACARALRGEPVASDEGIPVEVGSGKIWLSWSVSPWLDITGEVGGVMILARDIGRRKKAEAALRRSEARLRLVLETSEIGVFEVDLANGLTEWNAIEFRLFGLRPDAPVPQLADFFRMVHPEDVERLQACWNDSRRTGELEAEYRIVLPDGTVRWLGARGGIVYDPESASPIFLGINFDVSKRKRMEQALLENRQRMAVIVASAMDAIVSIGPDQRIVLFNSAAEKMFRCSAGEAVQSRLEQFFPVRLSSKYGDFIQRYLERSANESDGARRGEMIGVRRDGEEFPIEFAASRSEIAGKSVFTFMFRDVTERTRLEREILAVGMRERWRIGHELHDDICQQLVAAEFLTAICAAETGKGRDGRVTAILEIGERIRQVLESTRRLARGLAAPVAGAEGLVGALRQLAVDTEQSFKIRCAYNGPAAIALDDSVASLHLYRIAQEAISNAIRHGKAGVITVKALLEKDQIVLSVRDDGIGIPEPPPVGSGMGLETMRYRARRIGAELNIFRASPGGTEVRCILSHKNEYKSADAGPDRA